MAAARRTRVGVGLEILARLEAQVFENAHATMHTGGQGFMMAFAGSGANSLDRGLDGRHCPQGHGRHSRDRDVHRHFGRGAPGVLDKRYRLVPRGIAAVVTCGSYPAWNAYPGNAREPRHRQPRRDQATPGAILPMALVVQTARQTLADAGFDPNLVTLAADTFDDPITERLLTHRDIAIIDFTGSQRFGSWIEQHCRHALVYTETAGCNAVVLESTDDLAATARAIAHSVCVFSSQMCTALEHLGALDGVRVGAPRLGR